MHCGFEIKSINRKKYEKSGKKLWKISISSKISKSNWKTWIKIWKKSKISRTKPKNPFLIQFPLLFHPDDSMTLRPMPSPIQRQSSKYGKKEAEGHPKVFTSTPNSAVRKEVKLVGNLGNRSQSDQTKPVTVKLEPENSARTTIYRLGTKKIAKRRQTMVLWMKRMLLINSPGA